MEKLTRTDALLLGPGSVLLGAFVMWFPFSDMRVAHNIMSGDPNLAIWKAIGILIVGWGYIGWGVGCFIALLSAQDDFDRHSISLGFVFVWFGLTVAAGIALVMSLYAHSAFHMSVGALLIAWLLFGVIVMLAIIAHRLNRQAGR